MGDKHFIIAIEYENKGNFAFHVEAANEDEAKKKLFENSHPQWQVGIKTMIVIPSYQVVFVK